LYNSDVTSKDIVPLNHVLRKITLLLVQMTFFIFSFFHIWCLFCSYKRMKETHIYVFFFFFLQHCTLCNSFQCRYNSLLFIEGQKKGEKRERKTYQICNCTFFFIRIWQEEKNYYNIELFFLFFSKCSTTKSSDVTHSCCFFQGSFL